MVDARVSSLFRKAVARFFGDSHRPEGDKWLFLNNSAVCGKMSTKSICQKKLAWLPVQSMRHSTICESFAMGMCGP